MVPRITIPDPRPVRAFLDDAHDRAAAAIGSFAARELAPLPEPRDDAAARVEARSLLARLGAARVFEPIGRQDWRGCCLAREALGAFSPLADAVFALQGLGTLPILLAGDTPRQRCNVDHGMPGRVRAPRQGCQHAESERRPGEPAR